MNSDQILADITQVCRRVFARPDIEITAETTANDVAEWDSLSHTALITEIERHFKVRFGLREIMRFRNVGDICAAVSAKVG